MCMPKLLPMEADAFRTKGLYDLHLLLEGMPIGTIVRNDVAIENCDGTLIRGDSLWESLLPALGTGPAAAFGLLRALARGKAAFKQAVENDVREGSVRAGIDPVQVATVCISIWDGLVHSRIARLLQCDMEDTLRKAYDAVWASIRTAGG